MSIISSTIMLVLLQFIITGGVEAPKPLYRDPIHDGAADPEIIRNRDTGEWYMSRLFPYKCRQALHPVGHDDRSQAAG